MCRYDEDWEWVVESTHPNEPQDVDRRCEDCGRTVVAGEPLTHYVTTSTESADEGGAQWITGYQHLDRDNRGWVAGEPVIVTDYNEDTESALEALGFTISEDRDPSWTPDIAHFYVCQQCYEANHWLEQICDQHTVGVAYEDLDEHVNDYPPDVLGQAFLAMHRASRDLWRHRHGAPMSPKIVARLARHAVRHAVKVGLHP